MSEIIEHALTFNIGVAEEDIDPLWVGEMLTSLARCYEAYVEAELVREGVTGGDAGQFRLTIREISIGSLAFSLTEHAKTAGQVLRDIASLAGFGRWLAGLLKRQSVDAPLNVARIDSVRAVATAAIAAGAPIRIHTHDQYGALDVDVGVRDALAVREILSDPAQLLSRLRQSPSVTFALANSGHISRLTCHIAGDGQLYGAMLEHAELGYLRILYPEHEVPDFHADGPIWHVRTAAAHIVIEGGVPKAYLLLVFLGAEPVRAIG